MLSVFCAKIATESGCANAVSAHEDAISPKAVSNTGFKAVFAMVLSEYSEIAIGVYQVKACSAAT